MVLQARANVNSLLQSIAAPDMGQAADIPSASKPLASTPFATHICTVRELLFHTVAHAGFMLKGGGPELS